MSSTFPTRTYMSSDHLWGVAETPAGRIAVKPLRTDAAMIDAAWSNAYPANRDEGEHGSTILDLGRGIEVRASGHLKRTEDGWKVSRDYMSLSRRGSVGRGDLTRAQTERAIAIIEEAVNAYLATREGDLAQAEDIYRHNEAGTLEEAIVRHEKALAILHTHLDACREGEPFQSYPELPTGRR